MKFHLIIRFVVLSIISGLLISIHITSPQSPVNAQSVIATIKNSCIVNNTNIAIQNENNTPLDATNNWWGMPTGATHDGFSSGDVVGKNILFDPHLPIMPLLCDLTDADWIPFSEQDLQAAINANIPSLGGIGFALIDLEWGSGAKFDIVTYPDYGNLHDVAYISIQPNQTGELITLQLDMTRLPSNETVQKIVFCELMPLFVNSLQQVQNTYVSPSQGIISMVVMERDLMMRFSPLTEITPEPTPEIVMNYDTSCLPMVEPEATPSPTPDIPQEEDDWREWRQGLITIPPMEGEIGLMEVGLQQSQPIFLTVDTNTDSGALSVCELNLPSDCNLRGAILRANSDLSNHYVIQLPIDTYYLSSTLILEGHITLIGDGFYTQPQSNQSILSPISSTIGPLLFIRNNTNVAIYNLTFKDGVNGMLITESLVDIYHSRFENNSSEAMGGAISVMSPNKSSIHIVDTVFTNNTAPHGGAIAISADTPTSDILVACSIFDNNRAEYGGVIFTSASSQITGEIRYSNFYNNTVTDAGGAVYSDGVSYVQVRWSYATPGFIYYPEYPNSIVNAPQAIDNSNLPIPFDPNISECYIPPPPSSGECKALTGIPDDGSSGFGFWTLPGTEVGAIRNFSILPGKLVIADATRAGWYRVTYNGQVGWMVNFAIYEEEAGCLSQLPLINSDGSPLEGIYDYILSEDIEPTDTWLNTACVDGIDRSAYTTQEAFDAAVNENRRGCAKRVYFIYYTIFKQTQHRPPQMSDILATVYQNELNIAANSGISGIGVRGSVSPNNTSAQIAQDALLGHYWAIMDVYCATYQNPYPNCDNKFDTVNGVIRSYSWTLQAWFKDALALTNWYEEKKLTNTLKDIKSIDDLPLDNALRVLMPDSIGRTAAIFALSQRSSDVNRVIPFQWANFAYGNPKDDAYDAIIQAIRDGSFVNDGIVFCNVNLYYNRSTNKGREDVFIIITETKFREYNPSTYADGFARPDWVSPVDAQGESQYTQLNFQGSTETYLACPCDNTRCNRIR